MKRTLKRTTLKPRRTLKQRRRTQQKRFKGGGDVPEVDFSKVHPASIIFSSKQ